MLTCSKSVSLLPPENNFCDKEKGEGERERELAICGTVWFTLVSHRTSSALSLYNIHVVGVSACVVVLVSHNDFIFFLI